MNTEALPSSDADAWLMPIDAVAIAAFLAAASVLVGRFRRGLPLIPARPRSLVPWEGNDVLVIVFGFLVIASVVGNWTGPEPPLDRALAAQLVLVGFASILSFAWLIARGATPASLGLAPVRLREDTTLAITALAIVLAPLLLLNDWLDTIVPYEHPVVDLLTTQRDAWGIGLVLVTACVAAPIGEELFFRRILQGWLDKAIQSANGIPAVALASLAFAAAHYGQGLAFLPLFPLGVVLGMLAWRTGSIVPSILLHAFFNAVSVAILLVGATEVSPAEKTDMEPQGVPGPQSAGCMMRPPAVMDLTPCLPPAPLPPTASISPPMRL